MLVIRYSRIGKRNQPHFKIVVTEKRKPPKGGRFIDEVGSISTQTKKKSLNVEKIKHWLSVGAKPSPTVYNLLVSEKIIEGKKIPVHKKSKKPADVSAVAPAKVETLVKEGTAPVATVEPPAPAPAPVAESVKEPINATQDKESKAEASAPAETPATEEKKESKPVA